GLERQARAAAESGFTLVPATRSLDRARNDRPRHSEAARHADPRRARPRCVPRRRPERAGTVRRSPLHPAGRAGVRPLRARRPARGTLARLTFGVRHSCRTLLARADGVTVLRDLSLSGDSLRLRLRPVERSSPGCHTFPLTGFGV